MSVSSAEPEKLQAFVDRTSPARTSAQAAQRDVASQQSSVLGASPDYGVDASIVAALSSRLSAMHDNERFVATVIAELLAADHAEGGANAVVSASDASLRAALDRAGVGTPPPRLEFEPATLYGLPPTSGFVDDPICAANGNMVHQDFDLVFPGIAGSLDIVRTYNSLLTHRAGAFGRGWSSPLDIRLDAYDGRVEVHLPDGATVAFVGIEGGWASTGRRARSLERSDAGWSVALDDTRWYRFDGNGSLAGWTTGTSRVTVVREHDCIVRVEESISGRWYDIEWTEATPFVVTRIVASDGRWVAYEHDAEQRLTRSSSPAGHLDYEWRGGYLAAVVDADGVRQFRNEYDGAGRVVRQTSPFGRVTEYRYDGDGLTVVTDERGVRQAMVHDGRGNLTAIVDTDGSAMRLSYDHLDRVERVTDRTGAAWRYRYDTDDAADRLVERVDPDGLSERWEWDTAGRVTRRTDRSGAVTRFEYREHVRSPVRVVGPGGGATTADIDERFDAPIAVCDPDGVTVRFERDTDGQVIAAVDALGGRTTFEHDPAGRLAAYRDAAGIATEITHDAGGRIIRCERAGAASTYTRTAAGRIVGGAEPGGVAWSATFGPHGAPVAVTDALGTTLRFRYDSMGNVTEFVAPDGATYRHEHDEVGRLVALVDPAGGETRRRYDRSGNVVEVTDPAGRTARREVDLLGRTVRSIRPDGAITGFQYHANGRLSTVAGPDGRTWRSELDADGRVVALVDPAGGRAELAYTTAGRLAWRRSPAGRVETFEYDAAGRLVAIVDAAGARHAFRRDAAGRLIGVRQHGDETTAHLDVRWDELGRVAGFSTARTSMGYERDGAGRVLAVTDGTGARTEYRYDARGLLVAATDPAGATTEYHYDACGRLAAQIAPGGRTSSWRYDAGGRLAGGLDPAGVASCIARDRAGFVTGMSRGGDGWRAELDAAGREVKRSAFDGSMLGEYRYDTVGRLIEAHTPGWTSQFLWDDDDHITAVVDNGRTTLIERDADGWATAITRPDGVRTIVHRDPNGRMVGIRDDVAGAASVPNPTAEFDLAGRLLLGHDGTAYQYDHAGRLAEIAAPDGNTVELEYGADGLVSAEHRAGLSRRFTYDVAGRVASIAIDGGVSTRLEYDDAGRRLGEFRSDGHGLRYRWSGLDRLIEIVRVTPHGERSTMSIEVDALGRPRRVGGQPVDYDPLTSLPSHIGETRMVNLPGLSWRSDDRRWNRLSQHVPDGLGVGALTFLGARVLDQASSQFLTPDPLLTVPGSNGGASAYTYAWNDPVNFADPTGMRPISQEEWKALREREEQGRLGQAWQAIEDDPWGSLVAGTVIVAGAVLCFTPLAAVGVGIVIGVGVATGAGLATGTLDPRQIAFSGVLGGIAGGVGASGLDALASVRAGLGMGVTGELGQELIHGGGIDLQSIAVNGAVGALTGGIGFRMSSATATSAARVAGVGAVSDGSGSIVRQALTGDHTIDVGRVAFDAAGGAGSSVASHYFGAGQLDPLSGHPRWPATPERLAPPRGPAPQLVTVHRRTSEVVELQIQQETGLILRGRHAETFRAEVARDSLTAHTSTGPDSVAIERVGD